MFDEDFLSMMTERVRVKQASTRNRYGEQTFSDAGSALFDRAAYIVRETKRHVTDDGETHTSDWTVYISGDPDPDLEVDDQLVLPDDTVHPIVRVTRNYDEDGLHHVIAYLGAE